MTISLLAASLKSNLQRRSSITFSVEVPTSKGTLSLPQTTGSIALNGRQSKLIITDYPFGAHGSVLFTTASVFFAGTIGSRDVLFLFGDADQSHEFAISLTGSDSRASSSRVRFTSSTVGGDITTVSIAPGANGLVTLWDSSTQLILFADPVTAATFWAPAVKSATANTVPGFESFWQFGTNTTVLVGGPNLVRNATISGHTLALRGDLNASVPLTVVAPPAVTAVTWNGARVTVRREGHGTLTGRLTQTVKSVTVPRLTGWKFKDSLPEIQSGFDDSTWTVANKTTTNLSVRPLTGGPVLYGECVSGPLWNMAEQQNRM